MLWLGDFVLIRIMLGCSVLMCVGRLMVSFDLFIILKLFLSRVVLRCLIFFGVLLISRICSMVGVLGLEVDVLVGFG